MCMVLLVILVIFRKHFTAFHPFLMHAVYTNNVNDWQILTERCDRLVELHN